MEEGASSKLHPRKWSGLLPSSADSASLGKFKDSSSVGKGFAANMIQSEVEYITRLSLGFQN